ncbi:MAG: GNAT family N-acetyltransferase [Oscillospiraceae bacterium]|nr:GNAT family N-acetyltransferase [Oscillospiraceae bacterium]
METAQYRLRPLEAGDRELYMGTVIANADIPRMYDMPGLADYVWETTPEAGEEIFCIEEAATHAYCGFCSVRGVGTETPEVGLSLLPACQGKGIGQIALGQLLAVCRQRYSPACFIARVDSRNLPSLRLMEKIGAVPLGTEDTEWKRAMDDLNRQMEEAGLEKAPLSEEGFVRIFRID